MSEITVGSTIARRRKARLLGAPFFSDKSRHRLRNRGGLTTSRDDFVRSTFNNLDYLLRTRYQWMNTWINEDDVVVEIGAGAGLSPRYLNRKVILSDVVANPWLNIAMDGTCLAFQDGSIDVIIVSNALHHFACPSRFFEESDRVLKQGGLILVNDAYCSFLLRLILRIAHHEGYSFDVDVFDRHQVTNDPDDPWSGNNAVSNLLFDSKREFERQFHNFQILWDVPCESLLFLASGGVTSKVAVPELPTFVLDGIAGLDRFLVKAAPNVFALSRRTVLRKTASASR